MTRLVVVSVALALGGHLHAQQPPFGFADLGTVILQGSKGIQSLRGAQPPSERQLPRPVAGFIASECTADTRRRVSTIDCTNKRALEEAAAKAFLNDLLVAARAGLPARQWTESKWEGAKIGSTFKHASGAEINIGIPNDFAAGLLGTYGPVLLVALSPVEPQR